MAGLPPDTPVITGAGVVTALGFGVEANLEAVVGGRSAARPAEDAVDGACNQLALVERPYLRREIPRHLEAQIKFLSGSGELAVEAALEAWSAAGWDEADVEPSRKGVWLSQMDSFDWGCIDLRPAYAEATDNFTKALDTKALNAAATRQVKPFFMLESLKNNAYSFLTSLFECRGSNTGVAGWSGPTLPLLEWACRSLVRGDLDRALVVAAARTAHGVARRDLAMAGFPDVPLGEGAGVLAIERLGDARARGARPWAALLGHGAASGEPLDGVAAPTAETLRRAAHQTLGDRESWPPTLGAVVLPVGASRGTGIETRESGLTWRRCTGDLALASPLVETAMAAMGIWRRRRPLHVLVLDAGLHGTAAATLLGPA